MTKTRINTWMATVHYRGTGVVKETFTVKCESLSNEEMSTALAKLGHYNPQSELVTFRATADPIFLHDFKVNDSVEVDDDDRGFIGTVVGFRFDSNLISVRDQENNVWDCNPENLTRVPR